MPRWRWGLITSSLMDVAAEPEPLPCSFETISPYPPFPPWHEPGDISIAWIGNRKEVTLIITGGLRIPADFAKALALGADAIALSNSAIQAIGCIGMRACHTNNCPVGIATQKEHLRRRLIIEESANRLKNFFEASVDLIRVMARACGHRHIHEFESNDLTTWKREMADLSGIKYGGV